MLFTAAFTLIGEDQDKIADLLAPAPQGSVMTIDQDLYEEQGGAWQRPDTPVGEAHGSVIVTRKGFATCNITFTFGDDDSIVAQGLLPISGKSLNNGHLAVTGGTGQFDKVSGRVDMETQNPKRWSFIL